MLQLTQNPKRRLSSETISKRIRIPRSSNDRLTFRVHFCDTNESDPFNNFGSFEACDPSTSEAPIDPLTWPKLVHQPMAKRKLNSKFFSQAKQNVGFIFSWEIYRWPLRTSLRLLSKLQLVCSVTCCLKL